MNKIIEDYTKLLVKILQEDIKACKIMLEKQEIDSDHKNMVVTCLFTPNECTKKIKITFNYNELTKKINCSKTVLNDEE